MFIHGISFSNKQPLFLEFKVILDLMGRGPVLLLKNGSLDG